MAAGMLISGRMVSILEFTNILEQICADTFPGTEFARPQKRDVTTHTNNCSLISADRFVEIGTPG